VNIEPTLTHLLTRHDPFICLVKGEWGVGKTYFIKKFIHENHASIAKQSYSYVSLFGVSSAGDLMHAIYLNTVPTKTLETSFAKIFSRSSSDEAIDRIKLFLGRAKPLLSRLADIPVLCYEPIPYASEQGIFCGLAGNLIGDQGNFRSQQGIPLSSAIWADQSDPPGRSGHWLMAESDGPMP
jgi:Cdc6-like AAA superfamily ATPase